MSHSEKERLLSLTQAACILGVNPVTVKRWLEAGKLEGVRTPTRRAVTEASVLRMLEQQQQLKYNSNNRDGHGSV